jgi:uncharacterized membrane protein
MQNRPLLVLTYGDSDDLTVFFPHYNYSVPNCTKNAPSIIAPFVFPFYFKLIFLIFLNYFDRLILNINFKTNKKNIILIYFQIKITLIIIISLQKL